MKKIIKYSLLLFVSMSLTFTSCADKKEKLSDTDIKHTREENTEKPCCKEAKKDSSEKKINATLESEITCPQCGHKKTETLPTEVCLISYTCENCKTVLHPKSGDCCVFCTYGNHKCPSKQ